MRGGGSPRCTGSGGAQHEQKVRGKRGCKGPFAEPKPALPKLRPWHDAIRPPGFITLLIETTIETTMQIVVLSVTCAGHTQCDTLLLRGSSRPFNGTAWIVPLLGP